MVVMKAVVMFLRGDRDKSCEPKWFTDEYMEAPDDEEPYSDDNMPTEVPKHINRSFPVREELIDYLVGNDSSDEVDERNLPGMKLNRRGMKGRRKPRIVSIGKARKIRAGRV